MVSAKRITARRWRLVARPPGVTVAGELDPGAVHRVGEVLGRVLAEGPAQHLLVAEVEGVEDERDLQARGTRRDARRRTGEGQANSYM